MSDFEYIKQFHEIKDIADIVQEIEKLDFLVSRNDWNAVDQHLQDISQKHIVEKTVYDVINQIPPPSIQQSAANSRRFMLAIGTAKIKKEVSIHHGGN